jgi:hypothetical protein
MWSSPGIVPLTGLEDKLFPSSSGGISTSAACSLLGGRSTPGREGMLEEPRGCPQASSLVTQALTQSYSPWPPRTSFPLELQTSLNSPFPCLA